MKLSVVIPVYNGALSIERLIEEILNALSNEVELEIVLVNDYSPDNSWDKLVSLQSIYPDTIIAVNLSKNFGEHNAVMAGYQFCSGDYIVNIDDDFQNPPTEILKLLHKIQEGYDVIYSYYAAKKHSLFRNLGSLLNDKVANVMLKKPPKLYLSSFRIITARLMREIVKYDGPDPYIDGLILRATSKIGNVEVDHQPRRDGSSNYTFIKLLRLWSHMFFNFSLTPLRIASILGFIFSLSGFIGAIAFILEKILYPDTPIGWASIISSILILSGIQLFMIGIIGEYIGRLFRSYSKTPQFVVYEVLKKDSE